MTALIVTVLAVTLAVSIVANVRLRHDLHQCGESYKVAKLGRQAAEIRERGWRTRAENAEASLELVLADADALGRRR